MKVHKKEEFGKRKQHLAMLAKAVSHPARLLILKILAKKESCSCNDLVEVLPLSQATVSQHLKELKNSQLITGTSVGTKSIYRLNQTVLKKYEKEHKKFMRSILHRKSRKINDGTLLRF
jgi:ArsR family transcriptional regulator, arsenate/arsenite/antimonite-responsive transcriptional repressor